MPVKFLHRYTRQMSSAERKGALVVPGNAKAKENLSAGVLAVLKYMPPPTVPPHSFSFHYIDYPFKDELFDDDYELDNGIYTFKTKDAVLGTYDLQAFKDNDFCWSFATTDQTMVLAALKIGETFDVKLKKPFDRILHISRSHFPSGVPDSGYGKYAVHVTNEDPRKDWFRIATAFEPDSNRTESRLPFFFGFRVFGFRKADSRPVWRRFLSDAVIYAQKEYWGTGLMHVAFSLESFIDQFLIQRFRPAKLPTSYEEHMLRVGEKREELHALFSDVMTKGEINKYYEKLNGAIFGLRNSIAHGRIMSESIKSEQYVEAIKLAVEFIWNLDRKSRHRLVPVTHVMNASKLIDQTLIKNCGSNATPTNKVRLCEERTTI